MFHRRSSIRAAVIAALAATAFVPSKVGLRAETTAFLSLHYAAYAKPENLQLMREGRVMMDPHGITSIEDFAWETQTSGGSLSLMMDMEELLYLLPFIASDVSDDRDFAIDWFRRWYDSHANRVAPGRAAWDRMTTGIRAAVLSYFLCRERERPGQGISGELTAALELHRQSLMGGVFNYRSNHGLWEAIGLMEIGRVLPDREALDTALERIRFIAEAQVSDQGFHREHAPQYHFAFLKWLDEAIATLTLDQVPVPGLEAVSARMLAAGYFLQDHAGLVAPIGDSFRRPVSPRYRHDGPPADARTRFDVAAGYACYKEPSRSRSGRHVIFNIQPRTRDFPYHFHDDALAVLMSYRGELIFGDQGAYDYGSSQYRRLMVAAKSHNLVGPTRYIFGESSYRAKNGFAEDAVMRDDGEVSFVARRDYGDGRFTRKVTLPRATPTLVVDDEINGRNMVMVWNLGGDVVDVTPHDGPPLEDWFEARWLLAMQSGRVFELSICSAEGDGIGDVRIVRGSRRPMIGWYSASYREVVPSRVLLVDIDSPRAVCVRTTLRLVDDVD